MLVHPRHRSRLLLPVAALALLAALPGAAEAWPGLNGYLSYSSNRFGSRPDRGDIFVSPLDVESPIQLTSFPLDDAQSAWSRDGRRIAFKTTQFGSNNLAVMDADGSNYALVTRTFRVSEGQPAWSPDGTRLLYRNTPDNPLVQNADIWVLDIAQSVNDDMHPATKPILQRTGDERYPSYSPDGTKIVFRGDLDLLDPSGDEEIYVMHADGTDVRRLTDNADFDSGPAWSPDGTRIAFERAIAGSFVPRQPGQEGVEPEEKDIYVMDADGGNVHRLTDSPGKDEGPVWSPDGTKIAFSTDRDGQQEIYVMNADGGGQRRLTDNPARDESPDWQPLPFDVKGHEPCGDVSLAPGGVSSVVTLKAPCDTAQRVAQRWADVANAGAPDDKVEGFQCGSRKEPYDLTVIQCAHEGAKKDIAFVWRDPAP